MTEVMSPQSLEDSSWDLINHLEVKPTSQLSASYGVGRKVQQGKVFYSAKLPATSSVTGKSIKLGLFPTSEQASAAVQYALKNPMLYFQDVEEIQQHKVQDAREVEIMESSYCERVIPMKREYKEKQKSKRKSLEKKALQRDSQFQIGEDFLNTLSTSYEKELKNLKSFKSFNKTMDNVLNQILIDFFPLRKLNDILNEQNKIGAYEFAYDFKVAMWHNDNSLSYEYSITCMDDFIELIIREENTEKYGKWIHEKIFSSA